MTTQEILQNGSTPESLAMSMVSKLAGSVKPGSLVLVPGAGDGTLIKALNKYFTFPIPVDCYELLEVNRAKLKKVKQVALLGDDFLKQCRVENYYDVIVAHPPCVNNQDILHFAKMYEALKPGGVMLCLTGNTWTFGNKPVQLAFKSWLYQMAADIEEVSVGELKETGHLEGAQMIAVYKPLHDAIEIPAAILKKMKEACKADPAPKPDGAAEPLSQTDVFGFLRKYNGYSFFDCGLNTEKGLYQLSIHPDYITDPRGAEPAHTLFYDYTGPKVINEQIWEARKWVDALQRCRVCGCTNLNCKQCREKTGSSCTWIETDLCSACVDHQIKQPQQNYTLDHIEQMLSPKTKNVMNFFQELNQYRGCERVDITLRIFGGPGTLTINVTPGSHHSNVKPILITGTPEELDAEFFSTLYPKVQEIAALRHNLDEVKKAEEEEEKEEPAKDKKTKPAAKKAAKKKAEKPAAKKPADKKEQPAMFVEAEAE